MSRNKVLALVIAAAACAAPAAAAPPPAVRNVPAAAGGKLILDLEAGGAVEVVGTGGSSVSVSYSAECVPDCAVEVEQVPDGVRVSTAFSSGRHHQSSEIDLRIEVPARFDVELDSTGGQFSIQGVEGEFRGKTQGGGLTLRDVRGRADLKTMGGRITLTDSDLDGKLETMGGEVLFENVVGDIKGSSMGGNVRYKNVSRRGGDPGAPLPAGGMAEAELDTVQISTMGGEIEVDDAPEGADLHTMGGEIRVKNAQRFVRAKTMGGDITIDAVDGWIDASTMGGDIAASVIGRGGDVTLESMGGDIVLHVPAGFGMDLDLEIAYTRNSSQDYRIDAPGGLTPTVTPDWDRAGKPPRKYIRQSGAVNGGGHKMKIKTVNGNIRVLEGR